MVLEAGMTELGDQMLRYRGEKASEEKEWWDMT